MIKKTILIVLGCLFLTLGGVGVFIPVLPTTPFCILAGVCFSASSEKMYNWLLNSKVFGVFLKNYRDKTGIPMKYKIVSIAFLWTSLGISIFLVDNGIVDWILVAVGVVVTAHLLLIKTQKK